MPEFRILVGDALEKLRELPDGIARCCVTSPPFWGLRDYGVEGQIGLERTPEEYVGKLVAVFREVRRVLVDDGTLWLNLGDCYAADSKWGGTSGGLNETSAAGGFSRERKHSGLKLKDLVGIPWRVAFALQADGWWLRSDIIWAKPNPMPESVTDRPTKAHEYLFLLAKAERYYYDAAAIKEEVTGNAHARGNGMNPKRLLADPKENRSNPTFTANELVDNRNKRSVWTIPTQPFPEAHFATFPPALVEPCILAGSQPDDTILDPFSGAGTTGLVASRLNRHFLGIELNPKYALMASTRILQDAPLLNSVVS